MKIKQDDTLNKKKNQGKIIVLSIERDRKRLQITIDEHRKVIYSIIKGICICVCLPA